MKSLSLRTSMEQWQRAQLAELNGWQKQNSWYRAPVQTFLHFLGMHNVAPGDDWNRWWYEKFEEYSAIPQRIEQAVELGCGPYTNIRWILKNRTIDSVVCSDPLINYYLKFEGQWVAEAYSRAEIVVDNHPIEECPFNKESFDLVVLINVLDHVQDAMLCIDIAAGLIKSGGYFVIGQDLTDNADALRIGEDVAHPIRIHHEDLDERLFPRFIPRFHKILRREEGRNPNAHYGTYLLIGQRH